MKRLVSYVGCFVLAFPMALAFAHHVGFFDGLQGPSMQPVLNPEGDDREFILENRWSVRNYQVQRGDIVTLTSPIKPRKLIVKRVIALEGDIVRTLYYKKPYVTVPEGHCWVEGDNREVSLDSNYYGPVPVGLVIAKVTHVVWPLRRWQRLSTAVPSDRTPLTAQDLFNESKMEEEGTPKL